MKFRYYVTNTLDGFVVGTNNENVAENYAESDEFFVVDTETNEWLQPDGTREQIEEVE